MNAKTEKDRFDSLCGCTLIQTTESDNLRFNRMNIDQQQVWKRNAVNNSTRSLIPCSDCPMCNGTGFSVN